MSTLPLADIVPRSKKMLSRPAELDTVIGVSALAGLVEGLALAALLPTITALAESDAVWGLRLSGWLWVLGGLSVVSFVINYVSARRSYDVALDFLRSIHRIFGDQVAKQPLGWFARPVAGALSRLVSTELMMAGEILAHMISPLVSRATAALVIIVAAWVWSPLLGLVLTCAIPVFVLITLVSAAFVRRGRTIHEPAEVDLANRIVEYAQSQGALRSCGRSGDFEPLTDAMARARAKKKSALLIETLGLLLSGMVTQGVIVVLISVAGSLAVAGTLEPIPALAFIGLALRFTSTLSAITDAAMSLESRRPLLDQLDEVLDATPLPAPDSPADLSAPGAVALTNVTFGYGTGEPVLRDVSIDVPRGIDGRARRTVRQR
ncbi:ABC transporter transmembrane domain-containing protein [Gordonia humi]|uniref:ABC transporter transmembrane domain-containing protein n=1 Tax=Gordonia humi TaxID=686429 RepID=UPI003607BE14